MPSEAKSNYIEWLTQGFAALVRSPYTAHIMIVLLAFGGLRLACLWHPSIPTPSYFTSAAFALGLGLLTYCLHLVVDKYF